MGLYSIVYGSAMIGSQVSGGELVRNMIHLITAY